MGYYQERYYQHDFLVDVISKVSIRFKRLATDSTLWGDIVMINADKNPGKAKFVVQECINSNTRDFHLYGDVADYFDVLTSPRYADVINPTTRFPQMILEEKGSECIRWSNAEYHFAECKCDYCAVSVNIAKRMLLDSTETNKERKKPKNKSLGHRKKTFPKLNHSRKGDIRRPSPNSGGQ